MKAYNNLSPKVMKGEIWKDIPGYEGYYMVSNLGRLRSLDRVVPHSRASSQIIKGRVLKQRILKDHNKSVGDDTVSLQIRFVVDRKQSYHYVKRLVYQAFVKDIDFSVDGMYVINKDGNGYNNRVSNLALVTKSAKQQRSIKRGRHNFDYLRMGEGTERKRISPTRISVNQYTLKGKLVGRYKSLKEAQEITGISITGISYAAKGLRSGICKGYKWRFPSSKVQKRSQIST